MLLVNRKYQPITYWEWFQMSVLWNLHMSVHVTLWNDADCG